tara:strand:+ start:122 stop:1783 length:1662 start_codon:yes stop_codon:yes gene_type:complete
MALHMTEIRLLLPDDWHHHLRDGAVLRDTVAAAARQFGRAIVMPNLVPPVTTAKAVVEYRERIMAAMVSAGVDSFGFEPLMALYLTDSTTSSDIRAAAAVGVRSVKLYPAGATTNSDSGVTDYENIREVLVTMADIGLVLCVHGEVTDPAVDVFDRERVFVSRRLPQLQAMAPTLKIVLEHLSTREAVAAVLGGDENLAGTVTPQHLLATRNDLFVGGLKPHYFCLPILKTEADRAAIVAAVASGFPRLFLGTDSAPHPVAKKESECGAAGIFSAHAALELYAEAFEKAGALNKLEAFASLNGPRFYGLPPPDGTRHVRLRRESWRIPERLRFGADEVVPFRGGETLKWKLHRDVGSAGSKCEQHRRLMEGGAAMMANEFIWYETWSERVDCWWAGLSLATQMDLSRCVGALALHLGSRLEQALGRPTVSAVSAAAPGTDCNWVKKRVIQLELPRFPEFGQLLKYDFVLPAVPRLLPTSQQLHWHSSSFSTRHGMTKAATAAVTGAAWVPIAAGTIVGAGCAAFLVVVIMMGAAATRACRMKENAETSQVRGR